VDVDDYTSAAPMGAPPADSEPQQQSAAPPTTEAPRPPVAAPAADPRVQEGAGAQLLWVGAAMVGGAALLGPYGAGAAIALAGAVRNGLRARELYRHPAPEARREAGRNLTLTIVGIGLAGIGIYNALERRQKDDEK